MARNVAPARCPSASFRYSVAVSFEGNGARGTSVWNKRLEHCAGARWDKEGPQQFLSVLKSYYMLLQPYYSSGRILLN